MSFSPAQQGDFRPLVQRAWEAHCERGGLNALNKVEHDRWYRGELLTVIGVPTTKDCNKVRDFDACMEHFAIIANDEHWIDRLSRSDERRMRWLIRQRIEEISRLTGQSLGDTYFEAIREHMGVPAHPMDCPACLLRTVFQSLDVHVRRLKRHASETFHKAS